MTRALSPGEQKLGGSLASLRLSAAAAPRAFYPSMVVAMASLLSLIACGLGSDSALGTTEPGLVFSARYRQLVRAKHENPQVAVSMQGDEYPITVEQSYSIRLQLVPLGSGVFAGRVMLDGVEVRRNGEQDRERAALLERSAAAPFLVMLSADGSLDRLGFLPASPPPFTSLIKDLIAAVVVPVAGRAESWTMRQRFADGEYEVSYARRGVEPCTFERTQQRPPSGSPAKDTVIADRQTLCLGDGDPFVVSLDASRSFQQLVTDRPVATVDKSITVARAGAPILPPEQVRNTASAVRERFRLEPVWRAFSDAERRQLVSQTTLAKDSWESLTTRLQAIPDDPEQLSALSAKLRALFTVRPGDARQVAPLAASKPLSEAAFFALYSSVVDAATTEADGAVCELLALRVRAGKKLNDLFIKSAVSPRVPECLPPFLLRLRETAPEPQTRHQAALLTSAVLRRVRKVDTTRADSLFAALLAKTTSESDRLKYIGNYGRCADVPGVERSIASGQGEVRGHAYAALRLMECAEPDALLARGFSGEKDPAVRRHIVEALHARRPQPEMVAPLLRHLTGNDAATALGGAEVELLGRWYPSLPAEEQAAVRENEKRIPDANVRKALESAIEGAS